MKGELEAAIEGLGFRSVTVARPSLLLGDRNEFRLTEEVAKRLSWAFPRKYRPVHARDVAAALLAAAAADQPGVNLIENPAIARNRMQLRHFWHVAQRREGAVQD